MSSNSGDVKVSAKNPRKWPDLFADTITDFTLPEGTFFDTAVRHLVTTATIDELRALYPPGRFEVRRFRPNIVVATPPAMADFVENGWIGHTLPQADLPRDLGILRTAAQHNGANVGVFAVVRHGGMVRQGDAVQME